MGDLATDERLPSIRELASVLRVNPNTIAKVYGQLENEGVLESRRGSGFFVAAAADRLQEERYDLLESITADYVARAIGLGVDPGLVVSTVSRALGKGGEPDCSG